MCNGCEVNYRDCRWICLSCRPGKYRLDGFVDFCDKCMQIFKSKVDNEDFKRILLAVSDEDHD
jgi:hypothetical protein